MVSVASLWLPIVVSAVAVFFASFLAWMVLPHHKKDWVELPDEDGFFDAIKSMGIPSGEYMFPYCTNKDMKDKDKVARYGAGPWGSFYLLGRKPNFARNLILMFLFYIVVGVCVAYITGLALAPGAEYMEVFRISAAVGIMCYCLGSFPYDVFTGRRLRPMLNCFIDGVVFALITGGIFGTFWPAIAEAVDSGALVP